MDLTEHIRAFTEYLRQLDEKSLTEEEREALKGLYVQLVLLAGGNPHPDTRAN